MPDCLHQGYCQKSARPCSDYASFIFFENPVWSRTNLSSTNITTPELSAVSDDFRIFQYNQKYSVRHLPLFHACSHTPALSLSVREKITSHSHISSSGRLRLDLNHKILEITGYSCGFAQSDQPNPTTNPSAKNVNLFFREP